MSFFETVSTDMSKLQAEFLGPNYKYYKFIRNPSELGMSGDGSIGALADDIAGIIDYVELLVSGEGPASSTGGPLGDKFFLKTGGQCKDYKTGKLVSRSMYLNNVPTGEINFIPALPAMNVGDSFKGIIPGILNDLGDINPLAMFSAFMEGSEPPCAEVSLETINENGNASTQSGFVPINELKQLASGGNISNSVVTPEMTAALNPKPSSKETFINFCNDCLENGDTNKIIVKESSSSSTFYYLSFSLLMLYVLYKFMKKKN